jgi:septal ring factor EnvC (AmiA/AmiB activator)
MNQENKKLEQKINSHYNCDIDSKKLKEENDVLKEKIIFLEQEFIQKIREAFETEKKSEKDEL